MAKICDQGTKPWISKKTILAGGSMDWWDDGIVTLKELPRTTCLQILDLFLAESIAVYTFGGLHVNVVEFWGVL